MEPLHYEDNRACLLIVETAVQCRVVPIVHPFALKLGFGVGGLEWVVDNYDVAAPPSECSTDRAGQAEAVTGRREFSFGVLAPVDTCRGEQPPIPRRFHDDPGIAGVLAGKIVRVAHRDNAAGRVMAQEPRRESDRRRNRLQ
jgi:hypothetical protein